MEKREFFVVGHKPAYGKKVNEFIQTFDLGIDGAFIKFSDKITVTFNDAKTEEEMKEFPPIVKLAYENEGCTNVTVVAL